MSFLTVDLAIPSGINPAARMGIKSSSSVHKGRPRGGKTEISIVEQGLKLGPMTWAHTGSNGEQSFSVQHHVGTASEVVGRVGASATSISGEFCLD